MKKLITVPNIVAIVLPLFVRLWYTLIIKTKRIFINKIIFLRAVIVLIPPSLLPGSFSSGTFQRSRQQKV